MFVEAFTPSHAIWNAIPLTQSQIPIHRTTPLFVASTSEDAMPSTASIDYLEESQHHILTIPPFLPIDGGEQQNDGAYPSPLHKIHVLPLLTDEETSELLRLARDHATANESWNQQDSTRHVAYQTVDFAIEESIDMSQYLGQSGINFEDRVFDALSEAYDVDAEDLSFLDLFCASYEDPDTNSNDEGRDTMDELDFHRDGSLLSFTLLLSPLADFEGGGTIFDALADVEMSNEESSILQPRGVIQPPKAGYATLHSGKLFHGGNKVTKGQRIVLVGFVDVDARNMKPGALGAAAKEWGRNDVRSFWNQRLLSLLKQQHEEGEKSAQPVWKLKNWRYLPKDTPLRRAQTKEGRSYFGQDSVVPASVLENMESRAIPEKIRKRRLITEDGLLREILLPKDERGEKVVQEEGELIEVDLENMDMDGLMLGWDGDDDE